MDVAVGGVEAIASAICASVPSIVCWLGSVPSKITAAGSVDGRPCESRALRIGASWRAPGVAHHRAIQLCEAGPIHVGRRLARVLVPPHQRQRVARARVRQRHPRIAWNTERGRNPRDDLEGHAVFVEEQRLFGATIEDERVAPLETRDNPALARLLGEQVTNRLLVHRLGGCAAYVDTLRSADACRSRRGDTRWS